MTSPLTWYGGKHYLCRQLLALMPPHKSYIEVFCGAAHLLFAKKPSKIETINDINGKLIRFFRVMRDREKCAELVRLLDLTPYSRGEYSFCAKNDDGQDGEVCEIEIARRFFVRVRMCFGGHSIHTCSWAFSKALLSKPVNAFRNATDQLHIFSDRLRLVQIDNCSFERIFEIYDNADALFYCDPPYLRETRQTYGDYENELTTDGHIRLLNVILKAKGMVMLSGYVSDVYSEYLPDFQRHEISVTLYANKTNGKRQKRTEVVWLNPAAVERLQIDRCPLFAGF